MPCAYHSNLQKSNAASLFNAQKPTINDCPAIVKHWFFARGVLDIEHLILEIGHLIFVGWGQSVGRGASVTSILVGIYK
jgi:hypothetical protein